MANPMRKLRSLVRTMDEQGMVFPTALILLAVIALVGTTAVVTTSANLKVGGNFKTSVQAFYDAEAGIQDGIGRLINGTLSDSGSETSPTWNSGNSYSTSGFANSFSVQHHVINGVVVTSGGLPLYKITATGTSGSAGKTLEAVVKLKYPSAFTNALHGCDGVAIASNAATDSYSSSGEATTGDNGSIGTSNADADVTLGSNAEISGNVSATGSLTLDGNAQIAKNAEANDGISLNGTNIVGGDANTNGDLFLEASTIQGDANASGDIRLDHNHSAVTGDATAEGSISCRGGCEDKISGATNSGGTPDINTPVVPTTPCDPLNLNTLFDTADDIATSNANSELSEISSNYPYDTSDDGFSLNSNDNYAIGAAGQTKDYYFSDFSMNSNNTLTVDGDVTLYIDGDFLMNSNTIISLSEGASLKIYVTGTINVDSNAQMNNLGTPADLQIYSSAASSDNDDYKVTLNSNSGFYGVIYAPNAAIDVNSDSAAYGSIRGKYVNMSSNGTFHYDEDLQNLSGGGTPDGYVLVSWREVY